MKILFVTDYFHPHIGGVEKLFTLLASELIQRGNKVTYITWRHDKKLPKTEIYLGIEILRISAISRMLFPFVALPTIIREARKTDFIHTSTYSSAIGAFVGGIITSKKVVVTVHEVWGKLWNQLPFISAVSKNTFQLLERIMLRLKFHQYIAVSESTKQALIEHGIDASKIETIYNGLDINLQKWSFPKEPFTFTFFGRAGISKGLDLMVAAADLFSQMHPEARFKFIISPQTSAVYKNIVKRVKNSSLAANTMIVSNLTVAELQIELLSSHCIVIPSYCEGFGFTAAEASAMEIPIISSGKGSLPEVVSGKVIQMETFDAKGLYNAMLKAIKNEFEEVPKKHFPTQNFIDNHLKLYKSILPK